MGMDNRLRWSPGNSVGFGVRVAVAARFGISQSTIKRFLGRNMVSAWAAAVKIHLTGHGGHAFNSRMQEAETGGSM